MGKHLCPQLQTFKDFDVKQLVSSSKPKTPSLGEEAGRETWRYQTNRKTRQQSDDQDIRWNMKAVLVYIVVFIATPPHGAIFLFSHEQTKAFVPFYIKN